MLQHAIADAITDLTNYKDNPLFHDSYTAETRKLLTAQISSLKKLQAEVLKDPNATKAPRNKKG